MAETLPAVGTPAPEFTLEAGTGETLALAYYRGRQNVVLFFFPKADTPG